MTKYYPLFFNRPLVQECTSREIRKSETALNGFLRKAKRPAVPLRILSIDGNTFLNKQLASCSPKETELICLHGNLRDFRSKARFDLVFYSANENSNAESIMLEDLCFFRILLIPGGRLCISTQNKGSKGVFQWRRRKTMEETWLQQAGLTDIHEEKQTGNLTLLSGQRPVWSY
jgi:hypothetical protein